MTFDEYQEQALKTVHSNPDPLMNKTIWVLGIAGEAGEVVEKWKKIVAYRKGEITKKDKQEIKKELGDVVWYIAVLAHSLGMSFEEIVQSNITKLSDRKNRNVIKGSGDNR